MKKLHKRQKRPLLETDPYDDPADQMRDFLVRDTSGARPWIKNMGYAALVLVFLYMAFGLIAGRSYKQKINTATYCTTAKDLLQDESTIDNCHRQQYLVKWDSSMPEATNKNSLTESKMIKTSQKEIRDTR